MGIIDRLSSTLGCPSGYRLYSQLVRGTAWQVYLTEYVKPLEGDKILDIGCGPADILTHLPEVDYTGLDISADYIASATARFGTRGRFFCEDVGLANIERERGTFNVVLATGVVHHLNDEEASQLFRLARLALRGDGRLITFDGCYVPEQSRTARWLLDNDRGQFVRDRSAYARLASDSFSRVECHLRHDLLRLPYTHLIMRCSNA